MPEDPEQRVDRVVRDLLAGRRLTLRPGDAEEKGAIMAAAQLAGARQEQSHMSPAFRMSLAHQLEGTREAGWLTRRSALVAGVGLVAGALAGGLLGRALEPEPARLPGTLVGPTNGSWTDVGALADFADGRATRVQAGAVGAFVTRRGEEVSAVSSICSHLPCDLHFQSDGGVLNCPCHQVNFTTDGRPLGQAYPLPNLSTVQVRVTGAGRVEVFGT